MPRKRKAEQKDETSYRATETFTKKSKVSNREPVAANIKAAALKSEPGGQRIAVLLRAINVGGGPNRVSMKELVKQLQAAGMKKVETYLQSGNVVLSSQLSAAEVPQVVEEAVEEQGSLSICMARTKAEILDIIEHLPYDASDHTKVHVCFLTGGLSKEAEQALDKVKRGEDQYTVHGAQLYMLLPNGAGRATLTGSSIERALKPFGIETTSRNWRTVSKLGEMLQA